MNPSEFAAKWIQIKQKESATAQTHFNDICTLVGHKTPLEIDPKGKFFTFEEPTEKTGGEKGRADVWYKGKFIWEYKGYHKDLDKAYQQLLLYREYLGNPPLLVTSDTQIIKIHTNFTNTLKEVHTIRLEDLASGTGIDILRRLFHDPESFRPTRTQEQVTNATADTFIEVVETLKAWDKDIQPEKLAHFITRLLFSLFAEDLGLLPEQVFTNLINHRVGDLEHFVPALKSLFAVMREGGLYGHVKIPYFDGGLFDDDFVPSLPNNIQHSLKTASTLDWSGIDPSIFGTLFERVIDESKRTQLGAHYTSKEDILLVVEPVLMQPLRQKWHEVQRAAIKAVEKAREEDAVSLLAEFANELGSIRILDPACGSGNFLYVALQQLLDLQKEVIVRAALLGLPEIPLTVSPVQLFGIEINPYAHELAQITVWIGFLQWRKENGFSDFSEPILQKLNNIEHKDALIAYNAKGTPIKASWPVANIIIGNPPFLGSRKMRAALGDEYCDALLAAYKDRVKGLPDLVCYWFDKAEFYLEDPEVERIGLLATQAIRGGSNRQVLEKIVESGTIFMAWSDREWILDGAMVHVSIVGFARETAGVPVLDGQNVGKINSDLTGSTDVSGAMVLDENKGVSFQGVVLRGKFNISRGLAEEMKNSKNEDDSLKNSDVIWPRRTGADIVGRLSDEYVIDFDPSFPYDLVKKYIAPHNYLLENVHEFRQSAKQLEAREKWWLHWNRRIQMRIALSELERYIATPTVSKHRIFVWLDKTILPDHQLIVFSRQDDYFFGVLHSLTHEIWSRQTGTQLRDAVSGFRYTNTSTFETFPFPWPIGEEAEESDNEIVRRIAEAARELDAFRTAWQNPEEWLVVKGKKKDPRTLTNLYNALQYYRQEIRGKVRSPEGFAKATKGIATLEEIETLDHIHTKLDHAVLDAYGWNHSITEDEILSNLIVLNRARATQ